MKPSGTKPGKGHAKPWLRVVGMAFAVVAVAVAFSIIRDVFVTSARSSSILEEARSPWQIEMQ